MQENRLKFQSQFKKASQTKTTKKKSSAFSLTNSYMICAISSFFFLALFGALAIRTHSSCLVQDPDLRCCQCYDIHDYALRMKGQEMPRQNINNDIFYGLIMILNSVFGVYYVYSGVKSENKYLLFIMVITQTLECGRGVLDIAVEQITQEDPPIKHTREAMIVISILLMFGGFYFLRPLYKKFGWRIFKRGGAKRQIREMYKTFQRYRACNLLDIQSSFLLFVIYIMYLDIVAWNYYWVFAAMLFSDLLASRAMVGFMKQENVAGYYLCTVAKLSVIGWWISIFAVYATCYWRYRASRKNTVPWFSRPANEDWVRAPDLLSVYSTYNGISCLGPHTTHDSRTLELVLLNGFQAILFRSISMFLGFKVRKNFGNGLKNVFFKDTRSRSDAESTNNSKMINSDEKEDSDDEPNSDDGKWSDDGEDVPADYYSAGPSSEEMSTARTLGNNSDARQEENDGGYNRNDDDGDENDGDYSSHRLS